MSVQDRINEDVGVLIGSTAFTTWWNEQKTSAGDVALINNSFVVTIKSEKYVAVEVQHDGSFDDVLSSPSASGERQ